MTDHYDVIIIGTGAGGGTLARHLAPSGKRVLLLERGDWLPREPHNWSAQDVFVDGRYISPDTWHDAKGKAFQPQIHYFVGGATKLYGAALYRLRREDFGELHHHDGLSPAWPISYDDLEPYYTLAEQLYQVHGARGEDPTEPPSSAPYPYPALAHEPRIQQLSDDLAAAGYHPFHAPLRRDARRGEHAVQHVRSVRLLRRLPCPLHAKSDAEVHGVRPALEHPNVTLLTTATALQLGTNPSGTAVTEVVVDHDGETETFAADLVVVSCGAANTAKLLLASANDRRPHGLANGSDQVGRNFVFHDSQAVLALSNWRAIKRGDGDALVLAQRWSKYMAVTFAVGAVTGTVLTFEFGLLCPKFMGTWGAAFGIPFSVEGLFFFMEAIFIALYIYGWKRLRPWPHFWTGVPIVVAGIGGTLSVVAANAWMNEPAGFTLNSAGEVTDVDPLEVIFNDAWPYEASHMLVAAYLVGGFLVASVYAFGMLRGRRDRYHRLGFLIPFTVAAIATPIQMLVGDTLARWVYNNEPTKFAAIELVPETDSDVPETLLGRLDSDGEVTGGIAIPGLASWLSDPSKGTSTVVQGLDSFPADERPTTREVNTVHLAWDVMVGIGTLLFLLSAWYWLAWIFRRDMPRARLFLWLASGAGVAAVLAMEAGWVITEVGRQTWIVRGQMKVEDAATTNGGVWITFVVVVAIYLALATTVILVLRSMSRRFRRQAGLVDTDVPYGPSEPPPDTVKEAEQVGG